MRGAIFLALLYLTTLAVAGEPYITAGIGKAELRHPGDNKWWIQKGWDYTIDEDATSFKLGAGWRFNRYLAAEVNYHDLGKYNHFAGFMVNEDLYVESSPTKCNGHCDPTQWGYLTGRAKALSLSILPTLPITKELSVYGRLGIARYDARFIAMVTPPDEMSRQWTRFDTLSQKGTTPVYGGGIAYAGFSVDVSIFPEIKANNGACCSAYQDAVQYTINYTWHF